MKKTIFKEVELEERFFRKDAVVNEWNWLLEQLGIPEDERDNIDFITLSVSEIEY